MVLRRMIAPTTTAQSEKRRRPRRKQMLIRRPQVFAGMSAEASLGLALAWSGVVGGLLLVMILVRLFSQGTAS
jgi:hypothetical protein